MWTESKIWPFVFTCAVIMLFSCQEKQSIEQRGALVSITENARQELKDLKPLPDGGFVVGVNSRRYNNWDMRILRYDKSMNLVWERFLRIPKNDDLQQLHVLDDGQILVCGVSDGFRTVPDSTEIGLTRPYFHLLSMDGKTIWEVDPDVFAKGNLSGEQLITDVVKLANGDYRVASRFKATHAPTNTFVFIGYAVLFELTSDGIIGDIQVTQADYMEAIFPMPGNNLAVFFTDKDDLGELGFYEFAEDFTSGADSFSVKKSEPWSPASSLRLNGSIGQSKFVHSGNLVSFNMAYPDHIMHYRYDGNTKIMTSERISLNIGTLHRLESYGDQLAFISTEEGHLVVINDKFEIQETLDINWPGDRICKTTDDGYVMANQALNNINVFKLDKNGKWQENM